MEHKEQLTELFKRYLDGEYSRQDVDTLMTYFGSIESDQQLRELVERSMQQHVDFSSMDDKIETVSNKAFERIQHHLKPSRFNYWPGLSIAAAILAVLFAYLYFYKTIKIDQETILVQKYDVDPGINKAVLQTAEGDQLKLEGSEGGIAIKGNSIQYADGKSVMQIDKVQELKLTTPRGGTFYLELADGTKVWLNADSKIAYPSRFVGRERRVRVNGEVYFEVSHNVEQPFVVESEGQTIQVLGTSFNLRSYEDDRQSITTLLEGSIALSSPVLGKKIILSPNEQANVSGKELQVMKINAAEMVAWKDGLFRFEATTLYDALKQLQRWYDLEIDFSQIPKNIKVHAVIDRNKKLSSVLYAIEQVSNVKFKLTERRLEIVR